jgi:hypothetical protein
VLGIRSRNAVTHALVDEAQKQRLRLGELVVADAAAIVAVELVQCWKIQYIVGYLNINRAKPVPR